MCVNGIRSSCQSGYYSETGASECKPCEPGFYCPGGTDKISCPSGTYGNESGLSKCVECPAGTYFSGTEATSKSQCEDCKEGTYSATNGSSECKTCPDGK